MTEKRKPKKRIGRPPWEPSLDDRMTIEQMRYCGESGDTIARAIGVDENTLWKHCRSEMENGHANRRKEVISLIFAEARKGNISAQRKLAELGQFDVEPPKAVKVVEPKLVKLGKKEQALQDAMTPDLETTIGDLMAQRLRLN